MTYRERLLAVLHGKVPDCVPCCPDISNMVPARLTGKPFWDIYVYKNPPLWKAHIDAIKYFDMDGGFELYDFGDMFGDIEQKGITRIVHRNDDGSFVTQEYYAETGKWSRHIKVHTANNPPAYDVLPEKIGLSAEPSTWEDIENVREWPKGMELWKLARQELGDHGVIGVFCGASTCVLSSPEDIYSYYDNPDFWRERIHERLCYLEKRMEKIARMDPLPDFIFCGGSGSLIFQTPDILRELALPVLKRATEMAYDIGIPTFAHSCGPEKELVAMAVEETKLTIIDPLEIPPMGDCDLANLKKRFGDKIVLKGNLHTTDVMLHGSVDDVITASKKAIDNAGHGGGFILSTGDQCGRDTPDKNIHAMIDTARTYGKY